MLTIALFKHARFAWVAYFIKWEMCPVAGIAIGLMYLDRSNLSFIAPLYIDEVYICELWSCRHLTPIAVLTCWDVHWHNVPVH